MRHDEYSGNYQYDGLIKKETDTNRPLWMEQAAAHKNPHLTIELAESVLLTYDLLDIKLSRLTHLN